MLAFVGGCVGSTLGWALGAPWGLFAAYVVSTVGFGLGVYAGRRAGRALEG